MKRVVMEVLAGVLVATLWGCGASGGSRVQHSASSGGLLTAEAGADWSGDVVIGLSRREGYLLVPTWVDDQPAGWLMLDTGANQVVLDEGLANRMGLAVLGKAQSTGVAGQSEVRVRGVRSLAIGPGRLAGDPSDAGVVRVGLVDREVLTLSMLKVAGSLGGGVNGLIGFPALGEVPFTIEVVDERSGRLTLHDPVGFEPPAGAVSVPLRVFRRLPVVEGIVGDGMLAGAGQGAKRSGADSGLPGVRVGFIMDWGSDHGVSLPGTLMRRRPDLASVNVSGASRVHGVGGSAVTRETWARRITLFGETLEHEPISIEDLPPAFADAPLPIGRLGHGLMSRYRMTFDVARGRVYVVRKGE